MRFQAVLCAIFGVLIVLSGELYSQNKTIMSRDALGVHDMSSGVSPIHGENANACLYCHAPHSGKTNAPLWSQELSTKADYPLYTSDTLQNVEKQPVLGSDSSLCLSCHDGTVALGQTVPYGKLTVSASLSDPMTGLQASHPFSLSVTPPADAASLVPSLHSSGRTADSTNAVKLVKNNVECTSCHEPHRQNIDKYSLSFLSADNRQGALCLSCHTTESRTVNGLTNPLVGWGTSVHSTTNAAYKPSVGLGGYLNVADSACISCHLPHDAGGAKGLLRRSTSTVQNVDDASQSCINCHNGGSDKLAVSILDVYSTIGTKGHPFPTADNLHKVNEPVVLDNNRHASCVDCHDAHASRVMGSGSFNAAPGLRPSQYGTSGVASDGTALSGPAANQYETCLRCHGNSAKKQRLETTYGYLPTRAVPGNDELNLILQFGNTATSSHPVMRDVTPSQSTQPSLRNSMLNLNGSSSTRLLLSGPTRIFCTDCHNNDQNREFGGAAPNGPHGSTYDHILERDYTASKVNEGSGWPSGGPGTEVINPVSFPSPYPTTGGPFPLCAKCHDLDNVASNASFTKHSAHLSKGFSCSVCHTAHGVPAGSSGGVGGRLVNFDARVVAPNGAATAYNADGTCSLTCHMVRHFDNGGVQGLEVLTSASPRPF